MIYISLKEFLPEPIIFETQTTATAQDLFYYYDALGHFHDANLSKAGASTAPVASDYIELRGLGRRLPSAIRRQPVGTSQSDNKQPAAWC